MDAANSLNNQSVVKTEVETKEIQDDWRDDRSLAECAEQYLQKGIETDVDFNFKKFGDRKLKAHRLILSMRSAIFEAMFFGPMADNQKEIDIEDIEPDIFELMLRYIYTDTVHLKGETVLKCLYAGRKYCLSGLVKLCSSFLENSIFPENVCTIYEQARFFDVEDLRSRCYTFLTQNAEAVFQSEDIEKLSYESLQKICDDKELQSEEIRVFEMVLRWADAKCQSENIEASVENKRKVLGGILEKIRFPVIPPEVFVKKIVPAKMLQPEDQMQLLQFMVTMTTDTPGQVGRFKSFPRHNILSINFENVGCLSTEDGYRESVKLRSSCDIALISFLGVLGKFNVCYFSCEEDRGPPRILEFDSFEYCNGELRTKRTTDSQIILEANKTYEYDFHRLRSKQYVTMRKMNQVIKFGELSITVMEVPLNVKEMKFCRV